MLQHMRENKKSKKPRPEKSTSAEETSMLDLGLLTHSLVDGKIKTPGGQNQNIERMLKPPRIKIHEEDYIREEPLLVGVLSEQRNEDGTRQHSFFEQRLMGPGTKQ